MKKIHSIGVLLALAVSVTSCKSDANISPSLNFSKQKNIEIESSGGKNSLNYNILNRVNGAEITVQSAANWLSGIGVEPTSGTIFFTAAANYETERNATITVTYSLDGQKLLETEINLTQKACEFTHDFNASVWRGSWTGLTGLPDMYSIHFSDKGWTEEGEFWQPETTYYKFVLWCKDPSDPYNVQLLPGKYEFSETANEGTADLTSSDFVKIGATLEDQDQRAFVSGSVNVEKQGETYTITAKMTDVTGDTHQLSYVGKAPMAGLTKVPSIDKNEIFTANYANSYFGVGNKQKMHCVLDLVEREMSDIGIPTNKRQVSFEVFFKYDKDGKLTPGIYPFTIPDASGLIDGDVGTIFPGRASTMAAFPTEARGTHIKIFNEQGICEKVGLLTDGTLTIEETEGGYKIHCNLQTNDGKHTVQATYEGPLVISGVPGRFSTLTGDYTLDLSKTVAAGTYFGDVYGNGSTAYAIKLNPNDGKTGDGFLVEFVSRSFANFNESIPDGIFTAAMENQTARPGQFTQGGVSDRNGQLIGTVYVGGYVGGGMVAQVAPATEGTFTIKHLSEQTYTMKFDFVDDRGHKWKGEWSGKIPLADAGMNLFPIQSNLFLTK